MRWHKDEDGHWRYGDYCVEPYFLHGGSGGIYCNGWMVSEWLGSPIFRWQNHGAVDSIKEGKALVKQLIEEEANAEALRILAGMKGKEV
jgi:hypothetical protein